LPLSTHRSQNRDARDNRQKEVMRHGERITPQFSGRALPCEARRERIMKWRARAVAATTWHGPLQLIIL
jgi:hypothetical protein